VYRYAEAGIDEIRREAAAVADAAAAMEGVEGAAKGALRIFSGCVFLVVPMPAEDDDKAGGGRGGGGVGAAAAPFGAAEMAAAAAAAATVVPGLEPAAYSSPAMELIARNAAGPSATVAAAVAMGEARRLARGVALSLRLRGGVVADAPGADVTHVVAVTPTRTSTRGTAAEEDASASPVSERALALALRALAPPPPKSECSLTDAVLAGGMTTEAAAAREEEEGKRQLGGPGGGLLGPSARVVSAAWVLARIKAGQPVVSRAA
jgi:hypothetical protein